MVWRRRTSMHTTVIVLVLIGLTACGPAAVEGTTTTPPVSTSTTSTVPPTGPTTPAEALAAARALWDAAGLDSYQFVYQNDCGECLPESAAPRSIVVWEGATFDGARTGVAIEGLFESIERAIDEGSDVEVVYDPDLGFPSEIWIDREARAYDGGTHLLVHQVSPGLPGDSVSLGELERARQRWADTRPPAYEFRTDIICDCPSDTTIWALIDGDRVIDWRIEWTREEGSLDPAPSTVDQLFADLHDLLSAGELVEAGARISGSAGYHPELGYPTWIGLDIEVLDPDSALAALAPRVVIAIRDLAAQDLAASEHSRAVERWSRTGPLDYSYELTVHDIAEASFGPPHQVTVSNGAVVSVSVEGAEVEPGSVPAYAIGDLFALIDTWRADGWTVEVLYDARLGHPVLVTASQDDESMVFSIDRLTPG